MAEYIDGYVIFKNHGELENTECAGGGYHGTCSNCGMPLVTDLGYTSWANTECKVKIAGKTELERLKNALIVMDKKPHEKYVAEYIGFMGLYPIKGMPGKYSRPYDNKIYTIQEIHNIASTKLKDDDKIRANQRENS